MITILPLTSRVQRSVDRHSLRKKFEKQVTLLVQNPLHPSLHVELLHPKERGVRSFRIDRKYRALFLTDAKEHSIQIIAVTTHYQK